METMSSLLMILTLPFTLISISIAWLPSLKLTLESACTNFGSLPSSCLAAVCLKCSCGLKKEEGAEIQAEIRRQGCWVLVNHQLVRSLHSDLCSNFFWIYVLLISMFTQWQTTSPESRIDTPKARWPSQKYCFWIVWLVYFLIPLIFWILQLCASSLGELPNYSPTINHLCGEENKII